MSHIHQENEPLLTYQGTSSSAQETNVVELDAGALFVLKSRGSWLHCGYHLTSSIVALALLSLPYVLASLGWFFGLLLLMVCAMVTFYSYNLLSLVLEHQAHLGKRQLRCRDMATHILGRGWGRYFVGPVQFGMCYAAVTGCILLGGQSVKEAPKTHYSLTGNAGSRIFGALTAISIMSTTYGNGIIPEIQGLCLCYAVVIATFFSVAISGYWAFGNLTEATVIYNFMAGEEPLVPTWFLFIINVFILFQVAAVSVIYLQPTNEAQLLQPQHGSILCPEHGAQAGFSDHCWWRFFGDLNAVLGSFGCIPLDFVLPMVFYNVTFNPTKNSLVFWVNTSIAATFSVLGVLGAIASVRQIAIDSKTYHLFANL